MKLIAFLKSRTLWANVVLAVITLGLLVFLFDLWLSSYTRHGESKEVPDLSRMSLAEAAAVLEAEELKYMVLDSSEFNPEWPRGGVVDQYPPAGARVKAGREIKLTLNPLEPRRVPLPNLVEKTRRRAVYDLESNGFRVGSLSYVPYIGKDVVVEVRVGGAPAQAGRPLPKGTVVDLVLGQGLGGEKVVIPYVMGKDLSRAEQVLLGSSLNIGALIYDQEVTDTASARVYRQSPGPSSTPSAFMGTPVDLWLTTDHTKIPADSLSYQPDSVLQATP